MDKDMWESIRIAKETYESQGLSEEEIEDKIRPYIEEDKKICRLLVELLCAMVSK